MSPHLLSTVLVLFLAVLLALPLAWLSWISLRNLIQARAVLGWGRAAVGTAKPGDRVALHGIPRLIVAPRDEDAGEVLWIRCQVGKWEPMYPDIPDSHEWRHRVKSDQCRMASFTMDLEGRSVRVDADHLPTECHFIGRKEVYSGDTNRFWYRIKAPGTRTRRWWIPTGIPVTLVGRLDVWREGFILVPDSKAGLLLSPRSPRRLALLEFCKGLAGLTLVTVVVALGLVYYVNHVRPQLG